MKCHLCRGPLDDSGYHALDSAPCEMAEAEQNTLGWMLTRIREEATDLGMTHLVDQVDAFKDDMRLRQRRALQHMGLIPGDER